jgi:nucleoside 2-deoxyribosyltransferase
MKKIYVLQPFGHESEPLYSLIKEAAASLEACPIREDEFIYEGNFIETVYETIEAADLIVCDISDSNPSAMYQLGYAHALQKPVLHIAERIERVTFDFRSVQMLVYDLSTPHQIKEFKKQLQQLMAQALEQPDLFSNRPRTKTDIDQVFISYSHQDEHFLKRLLVHLRPLENEGILDFWADTKLKPGDRWRKEIENALNHSRVAILLVSADFLASQFIIENELPPLLAKAEMQGVRIVPLIVKPCRFSRDKNLSIFQAINSPSKPLISLSEGEQEKIYDQVAELVESYVIK